MNKIADGVIDVLSAGLAGAVLYNLDAGWGAYALMLLCGACQQFVGRMRGKAELRKAAQERIIAIIKDHVRQR